MKELVAFLDFSLRIAELLCKIPRQIGLFDDIDQADRRSIDLAAVVEDLVRRPNSDLDYVHVKSPLHFLAPEVLSAEKSKMREMLSLKTDMYAAGVILYRAWMDIPPHADVHTLEELRHRITKTTVRFGERFVDLPHPLLGILSALLSTDPRNRYESPLMLRKDIRSLITMVNTGTMTNMDLSVGVSSSTPVFPPLLYGMEGSLKQVQFIEDHWTETFNFAKAGVKRLQGPSVMFISGRAGSGKSCIVRMMTEYLMENDILVVRGIFDQFQTYTAVSVIIVILKAVFQAFRIRGICSTKDLVDTVHRRLSADPYRFRLMNSLLGVDRPEGDLDSREVVFSMLNASIRPFVELLDSLACIHPFVVVVENIQWADDGFMSGLHVINTLSNIMGWVFSFRTAGDRDFDDGKKEPVDDFVKFVQLSQLENFMVTTCALAPPDMLALTCDTFELSLGTPGLDSLVSIVANYTSGNGLFVRETLLLMAKNGVLHFDEANLKWELNILKLHSLELCATSVRDFICSSLEGLSRAALLFFGCASFLGFKWSPLVAYELFVRTSKAKGLNLAFVDYGKGMLDLFRVTLTSRFVHTSNETSVHTAVDFIEAVETEMEEGQDMHTLWLQVESEMYPISDPLSAAFSFHHDETQQAVHDWLERNHKIGEVLYAGILTYSQLLRHKAAAGIASDAKDIMILSNMMLDKQWAEVVKSDGLDLLAVTDSLAGAARASHAAGSFRHALKMSARAMEMIEILSKRNLNPTDRENVMVLGNELNRITLLCRVNLGSIDYEETVGRMNYLFTTTSSWALKSELFGASLSSGMSEHKHSDIIASGLAFIKEVLDVDDFSLTIPTAMDQEEMFTLVDDRLKAINDDLRKLPQCTNARAMMAMRILYLLGEPAYYTEDEDRRSINFIATHGMKLVLDFGMCSEAFGVIGWFLVVLFHREPVRALAICKAVDQLESENKVLSGGVVRWKVLSANHFKCRYRPLYPDVVTCMEDACNACMDVGDFRYATYYSTATVFCAMSTCPLSIVNDMMDRIANFLHSMHFSTIEMALPTKIICNRLGDFELSVPCWDISKLGDISIPKILDRCLQSSLTMVKVHALFPVWWTNFLVGDLAECLGNLDMFWECRLFGRGLAGVDYLMFLGIVTTCEFAIVGLNNVGFDDNQILLAQKMMGFTDTMHKLLDSMAFPGSDILVLCDIAKGFVKVRAYCDGMKQEVTLMTDGKAWFERGFEEAMHRKMYGYAMLCAVMMARIKVMMNRASLASAWMEEADSARILYEATNLNLKNLVMRGVMYQNLKTTMSPSAITPNLRIPTVPDWAPFDILNASEAAKHFTTRIRSLPEMLEMGLDTIIRMTRSSRVVVLLDLTEDPMHSRPASSPKPEISPYQPKSDSRQQTRSEASSPLTMSVLDDELLKKIVVVASCDSTPEFKLISPPEGEVISLDSFTAIARHVICRSFKTRKMEIVNNCTRHLLTRHEPYVQIAKVRSLVTVPLMVNEVMMGVVYIESKVVEDAFASQLQMISLLANLLASAIHNSTLVYKLSKVQRELLEANKTRSLFVANVSHELRTPLNGILASVDMLLDDLDEAVVLSRGTPLLDIQSSAESLLLLVSNLSNFLALSCGQVPYRRVRVNLRAALMSVVQGLGESCDSSLVHVFLDIHPSVPVTIYEDVSLLGYAIQHLVDNAVKVSVPGSEVLVRVKFHPDVSVVQSGKDFVYVQGILTVDVEDYSPLDNTLFNFDADETAARKDDLYGQVDESSTRVVQGLGTGLRSVCLLLRLFSKSSLNLLKKQTGCVMRLEIKTTFFRVSEVAETTAADSPAAKRVTIYDHGESFTGSTESNDDTNRSVDSRGSKWSTNSMETVVGILRMSSNLLTHLLTSSHTLNATGGFEGVIGRLSQQIPPNLRPWDFELLSGYIESSRATLAAAAANMLVIYVGFTPELLRICEDRSVQCGVEFISLRDVDQLEIYVTSWEEKRQPTPLRVIVGEMCNPVVAAMVTESETIDGLAPLGRSGNAVRSNCRLDPETDDSLGKRLAAISDRLAAKSPDSKVVRLVRSHSRVFLSMTGPVPQSLLEHQRDVIWRCGVDPSLLPKVNCFPAAGCIFGLVDMLQNSFYTATMGDLTFSAKLRRKVLPLHRRSSLAKEIRPDEASEHDSMYSDADDHIRSMKEITLHSASRQNSGGFVVTSYGSTRPFGSPGFAMSPSADSARIHGSDDRSSTSSIETPELTHFHSNRDAGLYPPELVVAGSRVLPESPPPLSDPPAPPQASSSSHTLPRRVLVVEDNMINARVVMKLLNVLGMQDIDHAINGDVAVRLFSERCATAGNAYDLILMDCQMPVMDGITATARIRTLEAEKGMRRTRIVALTAGADNAQPAQCRLAGMDLYMEKPIKKETMIRMLDLWSRPAGHFKTVS